MPGLGLQGGYGAGAAVDAATQLRVLLQRELEAEARKNAEAARLSEDARQFDKTLPLRERSVAVDEGGLGLRRDEFEFMKPLRTAESGAEVGLKDAQRTDIIGRPAHEINLLDIRNKHDLQMQGNQFGHNLTVQGNQFGFTGGQNDADRRAAVNLANIRGRQDLANIAASGAQDRMTQVGGPQAAKATQDAFQKKNTQQALVREALGTINQLRSMPGFEGAVGMPGPSSLFGILSDPIAGTDAANFASYIDTLKSQLTLPRLDVMRGLGPMSEREFGTVQSGATALNRKMSEQQFKAEMDKIERGLFAMGQESGAFGQRQRGKDGKVYEWDGKGWFEVR